MKKINKSDLIRRGFLFPLLLLLSLSIFISVPQLVQATSNVETVTPPERIDLQQLNNLLNIGNGAKVPNYANTEFVSNDVDLKNYLKDYFSEYSQTFQPWKTKAAVRAIAVSEDYDYLAVGGGYLYDNEIHIYRWNPDLNQYVKVWNSGDSLIKSDVTDVAFGETDHNDFLEIVATSADGHFYVFEQQHIYDPNTNTENMFAHVYTSPYLGQVWAVELEDIDKDFDLDIIVASWDYKIHVFEYTTHSGYPFSPEHWINYEEKWSSNNLGQHPTALVVGDSNYNGLPDFAVGTREGGVFVFENNGTILDIHGQPYPICQDNSYKLIYNDSTTIWRPIYSMAIGDLDDEKGDEVVIAAFSFNAYVLRYDKTTETYYLQKLLKDFEKWTMKDDYPADYYIDWGVESQNTYFNLQSTKLGTSVLDPLNFSTPWYYKGPYPYNSGASTTDYPCHINTTTGVYFHPNSTHASWETFDFGLDEDGTGNGNNKPDFTLVFNMSLSNSIYIHDIEVSISADYEHWVTVPAESMSNGSYSGYRSLEIDVDSALTPNKWDSFRYVNVTVFNTTSKDYWLLGGKLYYVHQPVSTALSVTVGTLAASVSSTDPQVIVGTVDGRLLAFKYSEEKDEFELTWDSWVDDRWTTGGNIWDLQQVQTTGTMPVIVGITNTDGEYMATHSPSQSIPGNPEIYDYDVADITQDTFAYAEIIATANDGNLYAFDYNWNYLSTTTSDYLSEINNYSDYDNLNLTVAVVELDSTSPGPEIIIAGYDPSRSTQTYDDYLQDHTKITAVDPPAFIDVWARDTGDTAYYFKEELYKLELTGQLKGLQISAQTIPSVDGVDIDDDGDTDLVISMGQLYLLQNEGTYNDPTFLIDKSYFEDINDVKGKRLYGNVEFVEFDHDGDFDIVMGYTNRVGATYFDNYGTVDAPKWVEKKELLNNFDETATINLYNLTSPQFVSFLDYSPYYTYILSYQYQHDYSKEYMHYFMLNSYTNEVYTFSIRYDPQTSYVLAVNPVVKRVEVNSFKAQSVGTDSLFYRNFGFHAIESWSTYIDLYNWTLTLDTADIDGDGRDEIVVGDYDNNIYFFEHMVNNTYKRTFRSPDLFQLIPTNQTPYASEQFGFEGAFNETIWNHVSYLVVNADTDHDGLKEVIALAGTVVYIFEGTGIDDTYKLIYRYDVLRSCSGNYLSEHGYTNPSGLSWAQDLDGNGYSEIVVAFEKLVLVLEPYSGSTYEIFGSVCSNGPSTGHYNLPGNDKVYENLTIAGLLVTDINNNGLEEIVVYGDIGYEGGWFENGFLAIIESTTLGYQLLWQAPKSIVENNRILTVEVADQDYDGRKELLVGGEKGLTILEYNTTSTTADFVTIDVVTSHLNYPVMHPKSFFGKPMVNKQLLYRSHDITQLIYSQSNNSYFAVWVEYNGTYWTLYYRVSEDGNQWYSSNLLGTPLFAGSANAYFPTVRQTRSGILVVAWIQKVYSTGSGSFWGVFFRTSYDGGQTWKNPTLLAMEYAAEGGSNPIRSPALFEMADGNTIGFGYIVHNNTYNAIKIGYWDIQHSLNTTMVVTNSTDFLLNGMDIAAIPGTDRIGITFSGNKPEENRADYDIWYMELNSTFNVTLLPRKVLDTPSIEHTPSLTYLLTGNHSAIITFDAVGLLTSESASYAVVSEDYLHWSEPDLISVYPDYVVPAEVNGRLYPVVPSFPYSLYYVRSIGHSGPKVTATKDGGYVILTKFDMEIRYSNLLAWFSYYHNDLLFQRQTLSSIDLNLISSVSSIATGDTDGDGLKEVLLADGNYAYLLELRSTSATRHHYSTAWCSDKFDNPVSDVAIDDTNGNGFPEILLSVQGDDTYVYEVTDISRPIINLKTIKYEYSSLEGNANSYTKCISFDINNDTIQDSIAILDNGTVVALLGNNGTIAWTIDTSISPIAAFSGQFEGMKAIFITDSHGNITWIDYRYGNTTFVKIQNAITVSSLTRLFDVNNDGTEDVVTYDYGADILAIYNGLNGSQIGNTLTLDKVQGMNVGSDHGKALIVVALSDSTVMAFDLAWNLKWLYNANLWIDRPVYVLDLDSDGTDEFLVTSAQETYLFAANGTIIWSLVTHDYFWVPITYDLNNDGILDIIGSGGGNGTGIMAVDGFTGSIYWVYSTNNNLQVYMLALDNATTLPLIYFAYYSTVGNYTTGIGAVNLYTGLPVMFNDFGASIQNFPQGLIPTVINGDHGVIVAKYRGPVKGITLKEFDYSPVPIVSLEQLPLKRLYQPTDKVLSDTVAIETFVAKGGIIYVNTYNQIVAYDYLSGKIVDVVNVSLNYGSILKAVAADPTGTGNKTGIFFYTDTFRFGYYEYESGTITWIANEYGKFMNVYDIIAMPLYNPGKNNVPEYLAVAYENVNYNSFIRVYKLDGTALWGQDVNLGSTKPDLVLAGRLRNYATQDGYLIGVIHYNFRLKLYNSKDGSLYLDHDGPYGYAEIAYPKTGASYPQLIMRYGNTIRWYDADIDQLSLITFLDTIDELLDIETRDISGDAYPEIFITQNGSFIRAIDSSTLKVLWTHKHSSFVANHLKICQLGTNNYVLLANDYHHIVSIKPDTGELLQGSVGIYSALKYIQIVPSMTSTNEESGIMLLGNDFYVFNYEALGFYRFATNHESENTPLTSRYITIIVIPATLFVILGVMVIVLITKRYKL